MDGYLATQLNEKYVDLQNNNEFREILEFARDIKESLCYMSEVPVSEDDPRLSNLPKVQFEVVISWSMIQAYSHFFNHNSSYL